MRISAIKNYQTNLHFAGENNKKTNKLKNAAGAAAIAIAAAVPAEDADAQIFYPPVTPPAYITVPSPVIDVSPIPDCFIIGDNGNVDYEKPMRQVFNEIDANGNENGVLSAKEVVKTERKNWNRYNLYNPFKEIQAYKTQAKFNRLSEAYNQKGSNPNTINYSEYKAIMKDYMKSKQITNFLNLFTLPGIMYPPPPPPPRHHHHRPDHPPRHR